MMDPQLDPQGRSWRPDSEWMSGMPVAAFQWMQQPPNFPYSARCSISLGHEQSEHSEDASLVPEFDVTTTNSQLKPGLKKSYPLLPFRALEEHCLPSAIQQRWEASVAASKSAEWRHWFKTLDHKRQKAHVKRLYESTKHPFWARLWLEYEEWSKPRRARFIAAAVRAMTIIEQEIIRKQSEEAQRVLEFRMNRLRIRKYERSRYGYVSDDPDMEDFGIEPRDEPEAWPQSVSLTRHEIHSLRLRFAPCYFRLPAMAVRFATKIFSGKSYEEATAEHKANFNSWSRESRVRRIEGLPDFVVWGGVAVHKDAVAKLTAKKKRPQTGKHRRQNKQPRPG